MVRMLHIIVLIKISQISAPVNLSIRAKKGPFYPLISFILGLSLSPHQFLEDKSRPHLPECDLDLLACIESYAFYSLKEIIEIFLAWGLLHLTQHLELFRMRKELFGVEVH